MKRGIKNTVKVAILWFLFPWMLLGWTEGLGDAIERLAAGKGSAEDIFFVHEHIIEVNDMALRGKLSDRLYQAAESSWWDRNYAALRKAAREEGLQIKMKKPSHFEPGTDVDAPLTRMARDYTTDITKKRLMAVEEKYLDNLKADYIKNKLNPPETLPDTDTDILVDPDATSEFEECARYINERGGTAYTNKDAARAEIKMARGEPITPREAGAYIEEVERLAKVKVEKARKYRNGALKSVDSSEAERLLAKAQLSDSQASKYLRRSYKISDKLREQYRVYRELPTEGLSPSEMSMIRLDKKMGYGRGIYTEKDALEIEQAQRILSERANRDFIETLGEIAGTHPEIRNEIQHVIADRVKRMSPTVKDHVLKRLEKQLGSEGEAFVREVLGGSQKINSVTKTGTTSSVESVDTETVSASATEGLTVMRVAMVGLSAYFMGKDGVYHALKNVKADTTVAGFVADVFAESIYHGTGFGYAWESAVSDMKRDYAKRLAAGEPPSLSKDIAVTIIKTGMYMGRDMLEMVVTMPDMVYEMITGEKDAAQREKYSKLFLAAVQKKMREQKALAEAKKRAQKKGVHREDLRDYFNCLCRGCGTLGGIYDPNFKGNGFGNCKCSGPLSIWKAPMATDSRRHRTCINTIAKIHYNQSRRIFEKWHRLAIADNAASVAGELNWIRQGIKRPETLGKAAELFVKIAPLLKSEDRQKTSEEMRTQLFRRIRNAVKKGEMRQAIDLNELANRVENIPDERSPLMTKLKQWQEHWLDAKKTQFPAIDHLIQTNRLEEAVKAMQMIQKEMRPEGAGGASRYPPAYEDPDFRALLESLRKKKAERTDQTMKILQEAEHLISRRDPRSALERMKKFIIRWHHSTWVRDTLRDTMRRAQIYWHNALMEQRRGKELEHIGKGREAIAAYRRSLSLQEDQEVRNAMNRLSQRNPEKPSMGKAPSHPLSPIKPKTRASSIYRHNMRGDVFHGGHWAGSRGKSDWIENDFGGTLMVTGISIAEASTDITTKGFRLVMKLKLPDGRWKTIDKLFDTNIHRRQLSGGAIGRSIPYYRRHFMKPIAATAFRLEFYGHGWFDATDIRIETQSQVQNASWREKMRSILHPTAEIDATQGSRKPSENRRQVDEKKISTIETDEGNKNNKRKIIHCPKHHVSWLENYFSKKDQKQSYYYLKDSMGSIYLECNYYPSGILSNETPYLHQVPDGPQRIYFPSGVLSQIQTWSGGKRNGLMEYFTKEGKLRACYIYRNDRYLRHCSPEEIAAIRKEAFTQITTPIEGIWQTSEGKMNLYRYENEVTGTYTQDHGQIIGRTEGNILRGYWIEKSSSKQCDHALNGNYYWGRIRFRFIGNRFEGAWGYCDKNPDHPWTGKRVH